MFHLVVLFYMLLNFFVEFDCNFIGTGESHSLAPRRLAPSGTGGVGLVSVTAVYTVLHDRRLHVALSIRPAGLSERIDFKPELSQKKII